MPVFYGLTRLKAIKAGGTLCYKPRLWLIPAGYREILARLYKTLPKALLKPRFFWIFALQTGIYSALFNQ